MERCPKCGQDFAGCIFSRCSKPNLVTSARPAVDGGTIKCGSPAEMRSVDAGMLACIQRIQHFATGGCNMPNKDRLKFIARECESELSKAGTESKKRPEWEYGNAESNGNAVPTCSKCGFAIRRNHKEHEEACW